LSFRLTLTIMSNLPQEQFNQLLSTHGNQLCDEPQRCEALLRDTFPGYPREVSLLVNALKQGIPQELLSSQGKVPFEVSRSRLTRKLIDNLFMQEQAAQWVIDSWSTALGFRQSAPPQADPFQADSNHPPTMMQTPSLGGQDPLEQSPTFARPEATPPAPQPTYGNYGSGGGYGAGNYGRDYGNVPPQTPGAGALGAGMSPVAPAMTGAPPVWAWYIVYCVAMTLVSLCLLLIGIAILVAPSSSDLTSSDKAIAGGFYIIFGLLLTGVYGVAPFLPKRPWAWIYHVVLICLGFTSCCCIPFSIPMLIFWLKPEMRVFFNMPANSFPANPS
jgi:hypothetical protein